MTQEEIDIRAHRGSELFASGFNCSQAVVGACCDLYDFDLKTALRVSASFGGGIGRMRLTCGAACGMFILAGLENGNTEENKPNAKLPNYALVGRLAERFKQENGGLICADLLGLNGKPAMQKRPCKQMIAQAVKIYLEEVKTDN